MNENKIKALYFEYPNEYDEIFEKFSDQLLNINVTDNKTYWIRPFPECSFLDGEKSKTTKLKIAVNSTIFNYLITNKKEKEEIDKIENDIFLNMMKINED